VQKKPVKSIKAHTGLYWINHFSLINIKSFHSINNVNRDYNEAVS